MGRRIAVTGASGFIGKRLVKRLLLDGFDVIVLVRSPEEFENKKNIKIVSGNLEDDNAVKEFLKDVDSVVHLVARQVPPEDLFFHSNVGTTDILVKHMVNFPIKQLVYLSTVVVYGDRSGTDVLTERSHCYPTTSYGLTKYLAEILCQYWKSKTNQTLTIFRPFNIYGEESTKGVIYNMIQRIRNNQPIIIYGDGGQTRDFMYVDDVVEAIILALKKRTDGIYNLGSGKNISLLELTEYMKRLIPGRVHVEFKSSEEGKPKNILYSIKRAKNELKWNPSVQLKEGLKKFFDE